MNVEHIASMARQIINGGHLSRDEAAGLASVEDEHVFELFRAAASIRDHHVGHRVRCCSIAPGKVGRCSEDCAFCSQSAHHRTCVQGLTVRSREEVFRAAMEAADRGAACFGIVNSGYGPTDQEIEHWGEVIRRIRRSGRIRVSASLGVLTRSQAERLRQFGLQRYHHNLETSRRYFGSIVTTHGYDARIRTLREVKAAGLSVCSGALFGLGETMQDRIDLMFELRDVAPDVVPLNFLVPIEGTPLAQHPLLAPLECLRIIALCRLVLPRQSITVAGGRGLHLRDLQSWVFLAGADGFFLGNYLTTSGRPAEQDLQMLRDLGLELDRYADTGGASRDSALRRERCERGLRQRQHAS